MASSLKQLEFERQLDLVTIRDFRKNGNIETLNNLYSKYIYLVYGLGLKYFKSKERARHLVETLFEKLTIELINKEISNLRGWLYVVARNYCVTELSKIDGGNPPKEELITIDSVSIVHPLDNEKHIDPRMKKCFEKLNQAQKNCIELFYLKKHSCREIAKIEGVDEAAVKENIDMGKKLLTVYFNELNDRQ